MKIWKVLNLAMLFSICCIGTLSAQVSIRDSSIRVLMVDVSYGGYFPAGDFGKRFGYTNQIGLEFGLKFKNNWYASLGGRFLFGDQIRENNILADLGHNNVWTNSFGDPVSDQGWIDGNGFVIVPSLYERGFTIPFRVGKIIHSLSFKKTNPNCGVFIETGAQFIQHQILMNAPKDIPYLNDPYDKGYDRMTYGVGVLGSIGYRYFSNKRLINFFVAFDYQHHFTRTYRFNFDLGSEDTRTRNDIMYGFRVGWCLPIYREASTGYYY